MTNSKGLLEHETSATFDGCHREPVDLLAARVVRPATWIEKFVHPPNNQTPHEPRIQNLLRCGFKTPPAGVPNRIGFKRGRLTVVSYSHRVLRENPNADTKHLWLVRCACGNHELRTQHSLSRKNKQGRDQCDNCHRNDWLREGGKNRKRATVVARNHVRGNMNRAGIAWTKELWGDDERLILDTYDELIGYRGSEQTRRAADSVIGGNKKV